MKPVPGASSARHVQGAPMVRVRVFSDYIRCPGPASKRGHGCWNFDLNRTFVIAIAGNYGVATADQACIFKFTKKKEQIKGSLTESYLTLRVGNHGFRHVSPPLVSCLFRYRIAAFCMKLRASASLIQPASKGPSP